MRQATLPARGPSLLAASLLLALGACTAKTTPVGEGSALLVSPAAPTVAAGNTIQFTATSGGSAIAVTWSVLEASNCGSVTTGGLYTAPPAPATCHVIAASVADASHNRSVTVTVTAPPGLHVYVSPLTASVQTGATRQFTATVTGALNTAVTWSVQEASGCGSVTTGGLYTAPGSPATCHVIATSVADTGVSGSATVTVTAVVIGVLVSPSQNVLASGHTVQLTATVTNTSDTAVTWSVQEASGCGGVSATGLYTAPTVATTTTCHVVATSHADGTRSGSAVMTVLAPAGPGEGNKLGINVGAPQYWDPSMVYADGFRQSMVMPSPVVDSEGWPLAASFTAYGTLGARYTNGRWTVYYDGTATVSGPTVVASGGPGGTGPDGLPNGSNTRWLQFDSNSASGGGVAVTFASAARNDGSGLAGLRNIKMMRPVGPGSTTSHRRDETISRGLKSLVQRFGTVRYMDFLASNWSQITTWGGYPWQPGTAYAVGDQVTTCTSAFRTARACGKVLQATVGGISASAASAVPNPAAWNGTVTDGGVTWQWVGWGRPLPTWSGFDRSEGSSTGVSAETGADFGWQGIGGPYEDVIRFANESGTDAWITIPYQADDDYITRVAQVFAFGSDGAMPYTSPQVNPVFPPLSPNLNLYIEYSNEVWNGVFQQYNWLAAASTAAGLLPYQYVGRQVAKISLAFREAFGDSEMPLTGNGRIRPVVAGWGAIQDQTNGHALRWIHEFMGDGNGVSNSTDRVAAGFPSAPHPVTWYVYGSAAAPYWTASGADAAALLNSMDAAGLHSGYLAKMNRHAAIYGLPMLAYEGGPEMPQTALGTTANNTDRPATPNMRDVMVTNHTNWSASGGDLFIYFTASTDPRWCFVFDDGAGGNLFADSPKTSAIDELHGTAAAAVTLGASTFQAGTAVPGTAPGGAYAVRYTDRTFGPAGPGSGSVALTANGLGWETGTTSAAGWTNQAGWVFLASDTASRTISISKTGTGTVRCFVDGVQLGTDQAGTGTVNFGSLSLGPGLHGVILTAVSGSATIASVGVN